ncbi:hypothetical protein [Maridesulfovibrio sp.]|uniref:hypothetical protein n=1 Tax=Maridesulfovibrio sp. TaxID=2795000 RepID=UPI002A1892D2|nr:hypothetical protein [Maridesulfovibrio sp.]
MDQFPRDEHRISGYCEICKTDHSLGSSEAVPFCLDLMNELDKAGRIDFAVAQEDADPACSAEPLFGQARGQMFGVMVYLDRTGERRTAHAFSGQYNGQWNAPGWVPPLLDEDVFFSITAATERRIKQLGREMDAVGKDTDEYRSLFSERRRISRGLMREIHSAYMVRNFRGELKSMPEIALTTGGLPTGTGDCCAPKLLNYAAENGFKPVSIAEFYYGMENRSGSRLHKHFYPSCPDKCGLILGYMLCGL